VCPSLISDRVFLKFRLGKNRSAMSDPNISGHSEGEPLSPPEGEATQGGDPLTPIRLVF